MFIKISELTFLLEVLKVIFKEEKKDFFLLKNL